MIAPLLLALAASAELHIAAASDLSGVREKLAEAFERESGVPVRFTLGSSGLLAKQVEHGAPFDVFLSANERFVAELARAGQIDRNSVRVYATGALGLWSLKGHVRELRDLTTLRHIAIANPAHAPYGAAAREVLEKHDLWTTLQPRIVYGENVRQALQYAESGNADAVLTAWPLLLDKPGAIAIPVSAHAPIRQAGGVAASSRQPANAARFLQFLTQGHGAAILQAAGFAKP